MTPAPWAGTMPETWRTLVLQQFFPDVAIPAAQVSRLQRQLDLLGGMR
jgi:hypothetical protein